MWHFSTDDDRCVMQNLFLPRQRVHVQVCGTMTDYEFDYDTCIVIVYFTTDGIKKSLTSHAVHAWLHIIVSI